MNLSAFPGSDEGDDAETLASIKVVTKNLGLRSRNLQHKDSSCQDSNKVEHVLSHVPFCTYFLRT